MGQNNKSKRARRKVTEEQVDGLCGAHRLCLQVTVGEKQ